MSLREFDLIDRYFSDLEHEQSNVICGIGDDAAVLDIPEGHELHVSVDSFVHGIHFFPNTSAYNIGYKSLAVNLSDIAAMGASPRWATLALTLPEINDEWLAGFARGFADLARKFGISLIGGDTTSGPLSVTIQIMGVAKKGSAVLRSGASPGDLVYVSACLGAASFASEALKHKVDDGAIPTHCLHRLHRPEPRVELGQHLNTLASAAIDISDGLEADLNHILLSSQVAAEVELVKLPVCTHLKKLENKNLLWQLALAAGDDYELCFTLSQENKAELERRCKDLDYPLSCIGSIVEGKGVRWLEEGGAEMKMDLQGFRHF
jgi:thiamine-monophosphate kinase